MTSSGEGTYFLLHNFGVSFLVLQLIGVNTDLVRETNKPSLKFEDYFLFNIYFLNRLTGPIERLDGLYVWLNRLGHKALDADIRRGALLILVGSVKAFVVSSYVLSVILPVLNNPSQYSSLILFLSLPIFTIYFYYNFSGYIDLVRGASFILGLPLRQNFKSPLASISVGEFWQCWHISLSSWFRDYIYLPLVFRLRSKKFIPVIVVFVFFLSALWHGGSINFIIWGGVHAFGLLLGVWISRNASHHKLLDWFVAFVLINISWIFFYYDTLDKAFVYLDMMIRNFDKPVRLSVELSLALSVYVITLAIHFLEKVKGVNLIEAVLSLESKAIRWCIYYLLVYIVLLFTNLSDSTFVYLDF